MYTMTKVMTDLFVDSTFPDTGNTFRGMLTQSDFWRVSYNCISTLVVKAGSELSKMTLIMNL